MSTFDEREQGFEAKFAHDEAEEFKAHARRARLLGLWAGELMGLEAKSLVDYATAVARADLVHPGDEDLLRKVFKDLSGAGLKVGEGQVMGKMDELLAIAREEIKGGG